MSLDLTLAELQRWLGEMPPIFARAPDSVSGGTVNVRAVLSDLFETLTGERVELRVGDAAGSPNEVQWALAACHLLWHPQLRTQRMAPLLLQRVFMQEIPQIAAVVPVAQLAQQSERGEELIRRTLHALGLRIAGESEAEAEDRLKQVDSVEHHRVIAEAVAREARARQVREQMATKAAEEAAAKVSRE